VKALTIYQPWASLIMIGAKPYEFRSHDYRKKIKYIEGQRIVIHASIRAIRPSEVFDLLGRLASDTSGLVPERAAPLLVRLAEAHGGRGVVELAAGLGTAFLGTPIPVSELFKDIADSDRLDHSKWAWPLTGIRRFETPVPCRGFQGFWEWPFKVDDAKALST
jgi:hypothetical protein